MRALVAAIGAHIIYALIWLFGRNVNLDGDEAWLRGPFGGPMIGERPYQEFADAEGLSIERNATSGGLIAPFSSLDSESFDSTAAPPEVRAFYENTAGYRMDIWAQASFPMSLGLRLLVATISREVDQLNFPVEVLESARGMSSEIVLFRDRAGAPQAAGWLRKLRDSGRVIYTGFYMVGHVATNSAPVIKVVFPMPNGNATVFLRPRIDDEGRFELSTVGRSFGDIGFYRVQHIRSGVKAWRIRSLVEKFLLYVDDDGDLRCDHHVRFLGLPVLTLHYRMDLRGPRA